MKLWDLERLRKQRAEVEGLLSDCWEFLSGANEGGMAAYKLDGRTERMEWNPPVLSFTIERHGGTVQGSSRAELQHWVVDVDRGMAELVGCGRRQLRPMNKRLDVVPIAAKIAALITGGLEDDLLTWRGMNWVRVAIGEIIPPDASKQTVTGRRKRFSSELKRVLKSFGWCRRRGNHLVFERSGVMDS